MNGACNEQDCERPAVTAGLCNKHYRLQRISRLPQCSFPGCGKVSIAKSYCWFHYYRLLRNPAHGPCAFAGCVDLAYVRGYCIKHYGRLLKHGDVNRTDKTGASGEKVPNSKLKEVQVIEIKSRLADGASQAALARQYAVSRQCINNIAMNRGWSWL